MRKSDYFDQLESVYHRRLAPGSLRSLREKAWEKLRQIGLPDAKEELFPFGAFYKESLASGGEFVDSSIEQGAPSLVFIDGQFRPELSLFEESGIVVLPLDAAMQTYSTFLNGRIADEIAKTTDPFLLANFALHLGGLFVYVPPGIVLKEPITFRIEGKPEPIQIRIYAARGASVTSVLDHRSWLPGWSNVALDFTLEEESTLSHTSIGSEYGKGFVTISSSATLKRAAKFVSRTFTFSHRATRHAVDIALNGDDAEASCFGLSLLEGSGQSHTHVLIDHGAPNTKSSQAFKTVLDDVSRASFEGKIYVRPVAQKTEAYQRSSNLLMTDGPVVHAKPGLEIFADDVKASHGATVSQLDEEALFYLQSRGLSRKESVALLVEGFCMEMVPEEIPDVVVETITRYLERRA